MEWWQKMVVPVRRVWIAVSSRVKGQKNGAGLLKLRDDIQTCGYRDVEVMWEMLSKTESAAMSHYTKRKQQPFWKILVSSNANQSSDSSCSANHAQ